MTEVPIRPAVKPLNSLASRKVHHVVEKISVMIVCVWLGRKRFSAVYVFERDWIWLGPSKRDSSDLLRA